MIYFIGVIVSLLVLLYIQFKAIKAENTWDTYLFICVLSLLSWGFIAAVVLEMIAESLKPKN